jgi:hypothetical protein
MLCNNLAIKYRSQQRYEEAAALHHKGLSSSPFAEHHDGLLWCAICRDDRPGIVTAAEQLWHFTQDYGYSRHCPTDYFPSVALALYQLGRAGEIGIWLERLDQWFEELDADEQREQRRDYLAALMSLLDFFSESHGDVVRRRLACAMESCGPIDQAVALHREAIAKLTPDDSEAEHKMARDGLQRCLKLHSDSKPWWKLW